MDRVVPVAPVLLRALQADRSRCLGRRGISDSPRRVAGSRWPAAGGFRERRASKEV